MTLDTIIYFGQYNGKTGREIQSKNSGYYKWLCDNWKTKGLDKLNHSKKPKITAYQEKEV